MWMCCWKFHFCLRFFSSSAILVGRSLPLRLPSPPRALGERKEKNLLVFVMYTKYIKNFRISILPFQRPLARMRMQQTERMKKFFVIQAWRCSMLTCLKCVCVHAISNGILNKVDFYFGMDRTIPSFFPPICRGLWPFRISKTPRPPTLATHTHTHNLKCVVCVV